MNTLETNYYLTKAINIISLITESDGEGTWENENTIVWNIKQSTKNIKSKNDVKDYFEIVKNKIQNLPINKKKKIAKYALIAALGVLGYMGGEDPKSLELDYSNAFNDEFEAKKIIYIADDTWDDVGINANELVNLNNYNVSNQNDNKPFKVKKNMYIKPNNDEITQKLLNHLKEYEGFRNYAYNLGDGAKTIGYGHAVFKDETNSNNKNKYSFLPNYENMIVGKTKISKEQAEILLIDDYKEAKKQLDRIFDKWKQEGIKFYITQDMYDSMISLIFNRGIKAFRNSDFIQLIKKGPKYYEKAADSINNMSSHNFDKYPGLKKRRKSESNLFKAGLNKIKDWLKS
jgi:GH24 family phage-related lysozyme (muramidase)